MTAMLVDENPLAHAVLPTFSTLYDASAGLIDASTDEQDVVFFGPPRPTDTVVGSIRSLERIPSTDGGPSRIARTVDYRDVYGHLVAEVYASGIACDIKGPVAASTSSALAAHVDSSFDADSVRRFRTRIFVSDASRLTFTRTAVARYLKDSEYVSDFIVSATDDAGVTAGRAWVTVAETAHSDR
ncbi:UNVERIFIED_ORG: hypothetical protein FNL38_101118 [Nocardia globerula]|uniref:Uncharacterized protein n=1 Tax=Nocardia globerula TaxID=1818 RepID=A0A652YVM6_NOCGL|nr:hypothetical protein [Rhodococcus globerulus]NMD59843.1 hypothetical protein [Nocardia globerula]PVX64059.1 hypothetical protein C8E04_1332 [Rhodococcus globerulus]